MTPSLKWKLDCRSRKQKQKNKPITRPGIQHCDWFILSLLLATFQLVDSRRRSHKRNRCSASDSVRLIFTRPYHSTLLITTPTTTPSQVKTRLYKPLALKKEKIEEGWLTMFFQIFARENEFVWRGLDQAYFPWNIDGWEKRIWRQFQGLEEVFPLI